MAADRAQLTTTIYSVLGGIAPEVEAGSLRPDRPLRDQVDIDSYDWLTFLVGLHDALGVEIPEADYAGLVTLDNLLDYLAARLP
ncbi:MAG: acyl carrier protein [Gammaproteobacteria bacterium]